MLSAPVVSALGLTKARQKSASGLRARLSGAEQARPAPLRSFLSSLTAPASPAPDRARSWLFACSSASPPPRARPEREPVLKRAFEVGDQAAPCLCAFAASTWPRARLTLRAPGGPRPGWGPARPPLELGHRAVQVVLGRDLAHGGAPGRAQVPWPARALPFLGECLCLRTAAPGGGWCRRGPRRRSLLVRPSLRACRAPRAPALQVGQARVAGKACRRASTPSVSFILPMAMSELRYPSV